MLIVTSLLFVAFQGGFQGSAYILLNPEVVLDYLKGGISQKSPNESKIEMMHCMYSNIKNRRYNSFQDGHKKHSKHPYRSRQSKYKRKINSHVLIELDGIRNYKYHHRVFVEYPAINYINKYGRISTNITDKLVPTNSIKVAVEITEIKLEESEIIRNNFETSNIVDKQCITNVSTDLGSILRSNTSIDDSNDQGYTLSSDSGISCGYSLTNESEQVSKICTDPERSMLYFQNKTKKTTKASMETSDPQQSFISNASTCIKDNQIKTWAATENENTIEEPDRIIFDSSKFEHSTPQKEGKLGLVSRSSMNKLCTRIMEIEKKVDHLQLDSIESDVAQAVLLVQILHRDLERSYIPSKKGQNCVNNLEILSQKKVNCEEMKENAITKLEDGEKDETFFSYDDFKDSITSSNDVCKDMSLSWGPSSTVCQLSR